MKKRNYILLSGVAIMALSSQPSLANDWDYYMPNYSMTNFSSHYTTYNMGYNDLLTPYQRLALRNYLDYEAREPCQNYRKPPQGFYRDGCDIKYRYQQVSETTQQESVRSGTVIASYEVNFAHDSSQIDSNAQATLDRVAREIKNYNPREVTVDGYADRSGSSTYNLMLSQRRADSVSNALEERSIQNRNYQDQAHGENDTAVTTDDGVRLRDNRRVVIQFLK